MLLINRWRKLWALLVFAGINSLLLSSQAWGQSELRTDSIRYSGFKAESYGSNVLGSPERAAYEASIKYSYEKRMARKRELYSHKGDRGITSGYGRIDTLKGTTNYTGYRSGGYGRLNTLTGTTNYSSPGGYGRVNTLNGSVRYYGNTSTSSRGSTSSGSASASAGSIRYTNYSTLRTGGVNLPKK